MKEQPTVASQTTSSGPESTEKLTNEADTDDLIKIHTELAIKHLRVTPATPSEQQAELAQFIAKKERKINELKEELAQHEEELRLLRERWDSITATDVASLSPSSSITSGPSFPPSPGEEDVKKFFGGFGKGTKGVSEKESIDQQFSNIKIDEDGIKSKKRKPLNFTTGTWGNISKGISALAKSDKLKVVRRKTMEAVHNVERSINDSINHSEKSPGYLWSPAEEVFNRSDLDILKDNDELFGVNISASEAATRGESTHVIGDDFGDLL